MSQRITHVAPARPRPKIERFAAAERAPHPPLECGQLAFAHACPLNPFRRHASGQLSRAGPAVAPGCGPTASGGGAARPGGGDPPRPLAPVLPGPAGATRATAAGAAARAEDLSVETARKGSTVVVTVRGEVDIVMLNVGRDNTTARHIYESLGFLPLLEYEEAELVRL